MAERAGGDRRGSSGDRRRRKLWMLSPAAGFGGNGTKVPCVFCEAMLDYSTVEADRKIPGGSYRRENVQPACRACNLARSDDGDLTKDEIVAKASRMVAR